MVFEHDLHHRICDGAASEARHDHSRRSRTASISRGPRRTIVATGPNLLLTCTHDRSFQGCCSLDSLSRTSTLTQASSYGMYVDAEGNLFKFSDFRSSCPRCPIQIGTTYHFVWLPSLPHTSIISNDRRLDTTHARTCGRILSEYAWIRRKVVDFRSHCDQVSASLDE